MMPAVMPRKLARAFHDPVSPILLCLILLLLPGFLECWIWTGVKYVTNITSRIRQVPIPALRKPSARCKELRMWLGLAGCERKVYPAIKDTYNHDND